MSNNILVTGGAGYIGAITTWELVRAGYSVVVLDNLSKGHRQALPPGVSFVKGDIGDISRVKEVIQAYDVDRVIHFAAFSLVGESVEQPWLYFDNNLIRGVRLIEACVLNGVKNFVLSSTAAVYGNPVRVPIPETHPLKPKNPYGFSKLGLENLLESYHQTHGLNVAFLRYFNAAGADADGQVGEDHTPETHLIPIIFQAALGKREKVYVFGGDYDTPDGTAIRDYIHVTDLARAHIAVLERMENGLAHKAYNLGIGRGYSVLEVLKEAREVCGLEIPYEITGRRAGDPPMLVADNSRFVETFDWQPEYGTLTEILRTAWQWHQTHLNGYDEGEENAAV
jgi:UDP-glucose 4-epimerase